MMTDAANILVVEDESELRSALADGLEDQGHRVVACESAEKSLACVRQSPPDVVIADLDVPGGGLHILRTLKEMKPEAGFICLTTPEGPEAAVRALAEGAFAYVTKPFIMDEVTNLVNNALRQQRLLSENQLLVERLQRSNTELSSEVSERNRMEEALAERNAALVSVGELAAGIAHELNNPLGAVMTFAHLLMMQDLPGPIAEDVGKIFSEAQRAAKVVQNILSFAREHETEKRYIDVIEAIDHALALKAHDLRVNNIEVTTQFAPDLPKTMVDQHNLTQVFLNLVTNAEQAMVDANCWGTLAVTANTAGQNIRLKFTDNGPGIRPEHLNRVFAPFFTTKEPDKGSGLGLSICRRIIQAHAGQIWVESVAGEGCSFYVELPIVGPQEEATEAAEVRPTPRIVGKRVLVVDDEPLFSDPLSRVLSRMGHIVEVAKEGEEAWRTIQRKPHECIILDLQMPGTDGKALFQRLQALNPRLAGKVIFVTGDTLNDETRNFVESTGNPWLGKPFALEELEQHIQACLAQER